MPFDGTAYEALGLAHAYTADRLPEDLANAEEQKKGYCTGVAVTGMIFEAFGELLKTPEYQAQLEQAMVRKEGFSARLPQLLSRKNPNPYVYR